MTFEHVIFINTNQQKKTPVVKDPTKEQEEKAEKANALNLRDRNSYSPDKRKKDQETVSDWLKNFNNR